METDGITRNPFDCQRARTNLIAVTREPVMASAISLALQAAATDLTVLISGETGTGKELLARLIHEQSPRRKGPFIAYNCSAIPSGLIESELFGHLRGAFTGAVRDRRGAFELAEGGSLFLDEVGELSPEVQPKLLRVIEERMIWPLGGEGLRYVNVRIIGASNHDLQEEVRVGRFRSDLYFRLSVIPIHLPPLRQRRNDIPPLIEHFIRTYGSRCGREEVRISESALKLLLSYRFLGNVRELEHTIARALACFIHERVSTGPRQAHDRS